MPIILHHLKPEYLPLYAYQELPDGEELPYYVLEFVATIDTQIPDVAISLSSNPLWHEDYRVTLTDPDNPPRSTVPGDVLHLENGTLLQITTTGTKKITLDFF